MGLFDFGKKDKAIKELSAELQEVKKLAIDARGFQNMALSNFVSSFDKNIAVYPSYDVKQNADRYVTTDDIYSIVTRLASTAAMVPIYAYQVKNEVAAKQLHKIREPHKMVLQVKALQLKALIDLPETDPVSTLLENPSDNYNKFEFLEAIYTSLYLQGNAFIKKERPGEGKNAGKPTELLFLYRQGMVPKISDDLPRRAVAWDYILNGQIIFKNMLPEDIIHIKYFNPHASYLGDEIFGVSPIKVLAKRLTQSDGITDVMTAQMQNGGVQTIVFDKAPADGTMDPNGQAVDVIGRRKDNFYRFLKNPNNAGARYFASGDMGSVDLGSTLTDMKVIEASKIAFKKVCNVFGTSDVLFNNGETSTESNVQEMTKRTYTNTILPNVMRVRDALIKGLLPDFKDGIKRDIREDISEIAELQPNSKEMAEWLAIAWWVAPNDKLEMMRFERNPNPLFDEPLIPNNLQTIDELAAIPPIDQVTILGN